MSVQRWRVVPTTLRRNQVSNINNLETKKKVRERREGERRRERGERGKKLLQQKSENLAKIAPKIYLKHRKYI